MKMMASLTQYQMKTLIVNFFVYQSPDMKRLHRRYGDNLVWLDATYKTCKYSLLLFFLDIQTNLINKLLLFLLRKKKHLKCYGNVTNN